MPKSRSGFLAWYDKISAFNVEDLFSRRRSPGPPRSVFFNQNLPADYFDNKGRPKKDHVYPTNQVITSKYTIITFLPRNLLEQFRRIANIFFLGIAILQFFSEFSTISPGLTILPLLIVLALTALKDGYEDIRRHQSDREVNNSLVRVLAGGDWVNPNPMAPKSRTFVRALIPQRFRKSPVVQPADAKGMSNGSASPSDATNGSEFPDPDIEYDDDAGETPPHHLFRGHEGSPSKPHWRRKMWEDLSVGDFVKIMDNEAIPADILICATSEDENVAYVETKNLDGETNLKSRNASPVLSHLRTAADCANKMNKFAVDCDRPELNLYRLNAAVVHEDQKEPVDSQMVLLRGTVLRNTGWVIGVVLYTGVDSKIVLNSGGTPSKRSKVERQMNPQVFINLIILAIMAVACGIADSEIEKKKYPEGAPWLFDDNRSNNNPSINGLITWAFALITFQNIVPISLYISIEVVRTCQALFIYFDGNICYEKTKQATLARSYNLSDDLGQIEYIFSDKTGTLTQNSMVFRQCSIAGKVYTGDEEDLIAEEDKEVPAKTFDSSSSSSSPSPVTPAPNEADDAVPEPIDASGVKLSAGVLKHFSDEGLKRDIALAAEAQPGSEKIPFRESLQKFFSVLALCHTVLTAVDPETGAIEYKAQSPDEAALVQAAADMGFVFRGRDADGILHLQTPFSKEYERFELLNILEFTSSRKRMSIIVRRLEGDASPGESGAPLYLLTKGADNIIFERLRQGNDELKNTTEKDLDDFAREGLRTLTLAYKVISEDEYEKWAERYHEASTSLEQRQENIEAVCEEMEGDLELLGATAIEDRLQDGVPETIADLKLAGIKIWVATGDKLETAVAIGHSTNLIAEENNIIIIRGGNESGRPVYQQMLTAVEDFFPESGFVDEEGVDAMQTSRDGSRPYPLQRISTGVASIVGSNNGNRPGGFVLVIDGAALGYALADDHHKNLLLHLSMQCEGVICCRVSPLQKALVVKLVKEGLGAMTLAIGDGANDVSMIQAADVGVGISGEEGLQAVNSSDYAIAQFRFLKRLLLVHGHWSYARNGTMILNFFYKNIICIGVLWWFQIYCGWSSNYVLEYTYLLFWNSFWTIAPVIGIGLFDRFVDGDVLMAFPELYRYGREGTWFTMKLFGLYMFEGVWQSAILYFLIQYGYFSPTARTDGYDVALYEYSTTMAIATAMAANLFNGLNTTVWTGWVFFAMFLGPVLIWAYTAIYSAISPGWFVTDVYGNDVFLFRSAYFWLCLPLTILLVLLPRYLWKAWKTGYNPDDLDILRYVRKFNPDMDLTAARMAEDLALRRSTSHWRSRPQSRLSQPGVQQPSQPYDSVDNLSLDGRRPSLDLRSGSRTDMSTGQRSVYRGFDFATEENGVAMRRMQSNLSERRQSSRHLPLIRESSEGKKRKGSLRIFSLRRKKPPTPEKNH